MRLDKSTTAKIDTGGGVTALGRTTGKPYKSGLGWYVRVMYCIGGRGGFSVRHQVVPLESVRFA